MALNALSIQNRNRHNGRQGFVLPLTLMVIALTTVVMMGVARQSLRVAEQAIQAERDLQRRWGVISCQQTLLDRADWLLDEATWNSDHSSASPQVDPLRDAGHLRSIFQLGSLEFDVFIADEDAKLNLNTAMSLQALPVVTEHLQRLTANENVPIQLAPERMPSADPSNQQFLFSSWGQVFRQDKIPHAAEIPRKIASASAHLTCWGDGKLNLGRASESSIRAICGMADADRAVPRLLAARSQAKGFDFYQLTDESDLRGEEIKKLAAFITSQSNCFSMWVKVTHRGKSTYEFHVIQEEKQKSDQESQRETRPWNTLARFAW